MAPNVDGFISGLKQTPKTIPGRGIALAVARNDKRFSEEHGDLIKVHELDRAARVFLVPLACRCCLLEVVILVIIFVNQSPMSLANSSAKFIISLLVRFLLGLPFAHGSKQFFELYVKRKQPTLL